MKSKKMLYFIILCINSITYASNIDTKHSVEKTHQADLKNQSTAALPNQGVPHIRRPFDLMKPIPPIFTSSRNNTESEKVARFEQVFQSKPLCTLQLYHMAHDSAIKTHLRDPKRQTELHALADAQGKTILMHAIENNDAPFASYCARTFDAQARKTAFLIAGHKNRPRVMLALIQKKEHESEEASAYRAISELNDVPHNQIPMQAIQSMFDLIDKHKRDREKYDQKLYRLYRKAFSLINFKNSQKDNKLARELQFEVVTKEELKRLYELKPQYRSKKVIENPDRLNSLAGMMLKPQRMMMVPSLEASIRAGADAQVDALLHQGCSVNDRNAKDLDALAIAAECGEPMMLRKFMRQSTYLSPVKLRSLIQIAQKTKESAIRNEKLNSEQALECQRKYDSVIHILKNEHRAYRWKKKLQLKGSIAQKNIGDFVAALRTGVNPNAVDRVWGLYSFQLLPANPLFLRLLFRFGGNPNVLVKQYNVKYTLFDFAVVREPAITEVLVIAGVDLFARVGERINLERVLATGNPEHLKALFYPKDECQQKLNPNTTITHKDKEYFLLAIAFHYKRHKHFQLLLDAGADPHEPRNSNGVPLAFDLINDEDTEYLRMALNPRTHLAKKLDPNMFIDDSDGIKYPSLFWAMDKGKPKHFQLLLDAGADPHICSGDGTPIAYWALFYDPKYLEMLIKKGLNPQTTKKADNVTSINYTLTAYAWWKNRPQHKQLLINAGGTNNAMEASLTSLILRPCNTIAIESLKLLNFWWNYRYCF